MESVWNKLSQKDTGYWDLYLCNKVDRKQEVHSKRGVRNQDKLVDEWVYGREREGWLQYMD